MNFGKNKNSLHTVKRKECRKLDWFRSYIFASVCWVLILLCLNFLGSHGLIITLPLPTFWISETLHTHWSLLSDKPASQASEEEMSFFSSFCALVAKSRGRQTHTRIRCGIWGMHEKVYVYVAGWKPPPGLELHSEQPRGARRLPDLWESG